VVAAEGAAARLVVEGWVVVGGTAAVAHLGKVEVAARAVATEAAAVMVEVKLADWAMVQAEPEVAEVVWRWRK